ncbi:uncharacterized protein LOC111053570 [Nilaparvata lugens]|uniref:uncharacterized protein LOC111053570 n=1 Tax=Nilaparvata lugens TaxID=108931 RepID=UPI00193DA139|nr:uncharacterized protein LOC111053570 [Nilaparvata lugens]
MLHEELIPAIKSKPEIWDAGNELFNNQSASDNAWKEIAQTFDCNVDVIKEGWEDLKSQYLKELKEEAELDANEDLGACSEACRLTKKGFESMQFIGGCIIPPRTSEDQKITDDKHPESPRTIENGIARLENTNTPYLIPIPFENLSQLEGGFEEFQELLQLI